MRASTAFMIPTLVRVLNARAKYAVVGLVFVIRSPEDALSRQRISRNRREERVACHDAADQESVAIALDFGVVVDLDRRIHNQHPGHPPIGSADDVPRPSAIFEIVPIVLHKLHLCAQG